MPELLHTWIAQGEHLQQDFKFRIDSPQKIAKSISAFCNTEGGRLLVGVKDNGKISGVNVQEEAHMIEAAAEIYTRPIPDYRLEVFQDNGKQVLVAHFQQKPFVLYQACDEHGKWLSYFRNNDENLLMPPLLRLIHTTPKKDLPANYRHNGRDLLLLEMIEKEEWLSISSLQKKLKLPRHILLRKLAVFYSWGLLEIVLQQHQLYIASPNHCENENRKMDARAWRIIAS
jgi:hypothetical protein